MSARKQIVHGKEGKQYKANAMTSSEFRLKRQSAVEVQRTPVRIRRPASVREARSSPAPTLPWRGKVFGVGIILLLITAPRRTAMGAGAAWPQGPSLADQALTLLLWRDLVPNYLPGLTKAPSLPGLSPVATLRDSGDRPAAVMSHISLGSLATRECPSYSG